MLVTEGTYTLEIMGTNLEFWTLGTHWFYFESGSELALVYHWNQLKKFDPHFGTNLKFWNTSNTLILVYWGSELALAGRFYLVGQFVQSKSMRVNSHDNETCHRTPAPPVVLQCSWYKAAHYAGQVSRFWLWRFWPTNEKRFCRCFGVDSMNWFSRRKMIASTRCSFFFDGRLSEGPILSYVWHVGQLIFWWPKKLR